MKKYNIFSYMIVLCIALIPVMVAIHVFVGSDSRLSHIISGSLASGLLLVLFIYVLLKNRREFKNTEERLISVLDSTAEGIYGMDLDGRCIFANKSCIQMLGYKDESELIGKNVHQLIHHSYNDGSSYPLEQCQILKSVLEGGNYHSSEEVFWKADGSSFNVEYRSSPKYLNGKINGGVVTFNDITEKIKVEEQIKYLSYHDPITGLYNLTFLYEEIKRLDVPRNLPFSVLVGDVNGLKLTNDIFGHEAGDKLLRKISNAIKRCCREDDIIARVGGDEFIILLPKTSQRDAESIKTRIYTEIEKEEFNTIKGGIALGIAHKVDPNEDIKETLKEAEVRMYKEKTLWLRENSIKQLDSIMKSLHSKSIREKLHSENVSRISELIAINLNLPNEEIRRVKEASYYHDIGKIVLDDVNLIEGSKLNEDQLILRRRHPTVGYRILSLFDRTMDLAVGALDHHEYYDGTGYPKGLKGEEISLLGRIIAVSEYYDFKTNPHSEIKASKDEAVAEIIALSGIKFDPAIADAFHRIMENEHF